MQHECQVANAYISGYVHVLYTRLHWIECIMLHREYRYMYVASYWRHAYSLFRIPNIPNRLIYSLRHDAKYDVKQ